MKKRLALPFLVLVLLTLAPGASAREIPGQYIVVLNDGADVGDVVADHRRAARAEVLDSYTHALRAYTARLSAAGLAEVRADARVESVTPDREGRVAQAQTLPAGINRIDADLSSALAGNGSGTVDADVAVYDTGIQTNHPDLNVAGGVNCLGARTASNDGTITDQNGHGTHVAGIVGAKDDLNGVVGVAPGVRLWSVRMGDAGGISSTSAMLCGIDWLTANGPSRGIRVVNASVGLFGKMDDGNCGNTVGDPMHQAICASTAAGLLWVFASGNTAGDLNQMPGAGYDEVLAVTAMADSNGIAQPGATTTFTCKPVNAKKSETVATEDQYTSWSRYAISAADQAHTLAAPGKCVNSTYKGSTYGPLTGTSMASPHVAGTAAMCFVSGQCSGTPAGAIQKLVADADAYTRANPGYGFTGDPLRPIAGRYYGFLVRPGLY
jgi:subtilisin family serine protease